MAVRDRILDALSSGRDHAVPKFEGAESRGHKRRDIRHLSLSAARTAWQEGAWGDADTLVLFAGFPRSGHSLVGGAVDSHPNAVVSHELDALGLYEAGLPPWQIAALIRQYSGAFRRAGQYWNGHCYAVPDRLPDAPARVLGDKKGDWTVRRALDDPGLIDRLRTAIAPRRLAIVNVVRNPYDNVATMSLRKGRHYDRLKIAAQAERAPTDAASLLARSAAKDVPRHALPEMIEDYALMCQGLETIRRALPPRDWFELRHEDLVADPIARLSDLFTFLDLSPVIDPARRAAEIVAHVDHPTRHVVGWTDDARDRVATLTENYDFLSDYRFDSPRTVRQTVAVDDSTLDLQDVHVVTAVGVQGDLPLLSHFLDHYAGLGIPAANIHAILNAPDASAPGFVRARALLAERGCAAPEIWVGDYSSREMWQRRRALQVERTGLNDWVISADVDELQVYPEGIAPVLEQMKALGADVMQGPLIDRVAPYGRLAPVTDTPDLFTQFPVEGDLMCQISRRPDRADQGGTIKSMLFTAAILPGLGGHGMDGGETRVRARMLADQVGIEIETPEGTTARRLARCGTGRMAYLAGGPIADDPRIKDPAFRLSFPVHVAHFKWHAGLMSELQRRRSSGLQTPQAERYSAILSDMLGPDEGSARIDLTMMAPLAPWHRARPWQSHLHDLRVQTDARQALRSTKRVRTDAPATAAPGWRLRQLTFGSAAGIGHFHSYYDIAVMDAAAKRIAAVRFDHPNRPPGPDDSVEVGVVDIDSGGFRPLARTRAWSWQQGPMLQWLRSDERLVWNDRVGGEFVAHIVDSDGGNERQLDRPVYSVDPEGRSALSLNFARLDTLRPGYGYAGGEGAKLDQGAPADDGLWKIDLATGRSELILSLSQGRETLRRVLTPEERAEHDAADFRYWFNHCKVSPDGRRLAVKLRWRREDGPWTGLMGVSMTCGMDGGDPRVIARAASHVMWHDSSHLYFWNQRDKFLARKPDEEVSEPPGGPLQCERLAPEDFTSNVHLRHIVTAPSRMIYDVPYQPIVELRELDLSTEEPSHPIATFPGHDPAHGIFRCDLHPVPSDDGNRIVVTSLSDGARQIFVLDRMEP